MGGVDLIVPATQRHALAVARQLRVESRETFKWAALDARCALSIAVRDTAFPYAWVRNGVTVAIAGVAGALIGLEGIAWIALTEQAACRPLSLARLLAPRLEMEKSLRCRLVAAVHESDRAAIRFVEWCGFHDDGEHGPSFTRYVWERA